MIRNQFIHQVGWTPAHREMAQFGLDRINDDRSTEVAKKFGDPHVIIFRCRGAEAPVIQQHFKEEIEFIQVFSILPNAVGGIHKDGLDRQCAFNVPILQCDHGLMEWYPNNLESWTHNSPYTKVRIAVNTEDAVPLFSTLVERPSLVNTDVWHRMNNAEGNDFRYMLSLRFTRNRSFEEMKHEFP